MNVQPAEDSRSLGQLFSTLASETGTLMRKELQLARTEIAKKVKDRRKDAGILGLGGALAHVGLLLFLFGVVLVLGLAIPLWLSALIIGAVVCAAGVLAMRQGARAVKNADMTPHATIETLKEDGAWMRRQLG